MNWTKIKKKISRDNKINFVVYLIFTTVVFGFKWQGLNFPIYWDEIIVYSEAAFSIVNNGLLNTLAKPEISFYHPPGYNLLYAIPMIIFGANQFTIRIVTALVTILSLIFIYKLGKHLANRPAGILAGLLFFSIPEIFSQSTSMIADNMVAMFAIGCAYAAFTKNYKMLLILGFIVGGVRETAIATIFISFPVILMHKERRFFPYIAAAAPLFSFLIYLSWLFFIEGTMTPQYTFKEGHFQTNTNFFLNNLNNVFHIVFEQRGKTGLSTLLEISLFFVFVKKVFFFIKNFKIQELPDDHYLKFFSKKLMLLSERKIFLIITLLFSSSFIIILSFNSGALPRYFYPIYPFYVLLICISLNYVHKILLILVIALNFKPFKEEYSIPSYVENGSYHEYTIRHEQVIKLHQKAMKYLSDNYPTDTRIYTEWPIYNMIQKSYYGWVKNNYENITSKENTDFDLLIWSNNLHPNFSENKDKLISKYNLKLIKRIEENHNTVEFYKREAHDER